MYHFEAFSNKLTDLLRGLPALDEDMIKSFVLTELEPVCTHDEFSFLYTQLVLKNLSLSHENGKLSLYRLRRIAYELDQYLSDVEGGKVMSEALVCSKGLSQELSVAIINIISAKNAKPSAADLIRLYRAYSQPSHPSVIHMRHPIFLENLLVDSFGPSPSPSHVEQRFFLLAMASAVVERPDGSSDKSRVEPTIAALEEFQALKRRVNSMSQIQDHFETFLGLIKAPLISKAILMWLSEALHDPNFYEWTSFAVGETPVAFYLFDEIAHHQSLLRREVTSQWLKLLERPFEIKEIKPEAAQKCREKYLDHLLILAKLDHAGHILRYFEERVGAMDSSLILYFIRSLISIMEAPYPEGVAGHIGQVIFKLSPMVLKASEGHLEFQAFFEQVLESTTPLSGGNRDLMVKVLNHLVT